jgi:hypothetical protein
VNELGAGGGGGGSEVRLFHECDLEATAGGVAGDTGAIDSAADDQEVDIVAGGRISRWAHELTATRTDLAAQTADTGVENTRSPRRKGIRRTIAA